MRLPSEILLACVLWGCTGETASNQKSAAIGPALLSCTSGDALPSVFASIDVSNAGLIGFNAPFCKVTNPDKCFPSGGAGALSFVRFGEGTFLGSAYLGGANDPFFSITGQVAVDLSTASTDPQPPGLTSYQGTVEVDVVYRDGQKFVGPTQLSLPAQCTATMPLGGPPAVDAGAPASDLAPPTASPDFAWPWVDPPSPDLAPPPPPPNQCNNGGPC